MTEKLCYTEPATPSFACRVIEEIDKHLVLYPGDDYASYFFDHPNLDPFKIAASLKGGDSSSVDLQPVDQYLVGDFVLSPLLHGHGGILCDRYQFPKLQIDTNIHLPQPIDNLDKLGFTNIPVSYFGMSQIELMINRAFQAMLFTHDINVSKYPELEYPYGFKTIPSLIRLGYATKELCARIFIHRSLQNPLAMQSMKANYNELDQPGIDDTNNNPKNSALPKAELIYEIKKWAKHLSQDWEQTPEVVFIDQGRDNLGLPRRVNVQHWARLKLDPDFVHLARNKIFNLARNIIKVVANYDNLPDTNQSEYSNDVSDNNNFVDRVLPESELISTIMFEMWTVNKHLSAEEAKVPKFDQLDMSRLNSDPTAILLDKTHKYITKFPGIISNIPQDDIFDLAENAEHSDPLLDDPVDEVCTPPSDYYIYVHPKIWEFVGPELGSNLKLR